jgi:hypothetical protein
MQKETPYAQDISFIYTLYLCNAMEINYYRVYDMWLLQVYIK